MRAVLFVTMGVPMSVIMVVIVIVIVRMDAVLCPRLFLQIGQLLMQDIVCQFQGYFIQHGQGANWHTELKAAILDSGSRDAFAEQGHAFVYERTEHAAREKPARIVDNNRRLADLQDKVVRLGQGLRARLLALDDLHKIHLVYWREKMEADEPLRSR